MTEWDRLHRRAQMIKDRYPAGTRIMLLHMGSDPRPVEPNSKGTVVAVDDIGTVHCDFDNGRSLGMIPGEDTFRTLTAEEIAEEQSVDESEAPTMKLFSDSRIYDSEVPEGMYRYDFREAIGSA